MERWGLAKRVVRWVNASQNRFEIRRVDDRGRAVGSTSAPKPPPEGIRELVARLYLSGDGLEIGGLNAPLRLPSGAQARYVDRLSTAELRETYPEGPGFHLVEVDIVDDGERLASIPEGSQDFIVANHFLEHCEDPIRTIQTLASRVVPGGVLYMAVPDADFTFDAKRPSTPFAHILADHSAGPEQSRVSHYEEWVTLVEGYADEAAVERRRTLMDMDYSIHFHVWRMHDLLDFFARAIDETGVPLSFELAMRNGAEVICVIRSVSEPR